MNYQHLVDQYIKKKPNWSQALISLREIIATTELQETIKWGAPVYTIDGKNIVGLGAFKEFVALWFFQGALLKDPAKVLFNAQEGKTKALRQWRFYSQSEVQAELLKSYLAEAIHNQKSGVYLKPDPPKRKPLVIPPELQHRLIKDSFLSEKFDCLSLSKKREFTEYISTAKKTETKNQRLEKVVGLILENKGLYHKY